MVSNFQATSPAISISSPAWKGRRRSACRSPGFATARQIVRMSWMKRLAVRGKFAN